MLRDGDGVKKCDMENTGWLVRSDPLGPFQKAEWAPSGPTFSVGMCPLGIFGAHFEKLALRNGLFSLFGLSFRFKIRKTVQKTPMDRPKKHVV